VAPSGGRSRNYARGVYAPVPVIGEVNLNRRERRVHAGLRTLVDSPGMTLGVIPHARRGVRNRIMTKKQHPAQSASRQAHAWWARNAYGGQGRTRALQALEASGIPRRPILASKDVLSAMARGEALVKGAATLTVPQRGSSGKSTRYLRLIQWRMVMAYAGFEVLAKACLGKREQKGLDPEDINHLASFCLRASPNLETPRLTPDTARWLCRSGKGEPIDIVADFLHLRSGHKQFMLEWFKGTPIATHAGACHLAKILRNATAHGVLSPSKCHGLGLTEAIRTAPQVINGIRLSLIETIYESRPQADRDFPPIP